MDVRRLSADELGRCADLVAAQQRVPELHIGYLATEAGAVADQFRGLPPAGLDGVVVAWDRREPVGLLGAEWDTDPPRLWWWGPFAFDDRRWDEIAEALYAAARQLPPPEIVQEEFCPDRRNRRVAAFAQRLGFVAEEGGALLGRRLADLGSLAGVGPPSLSVRPLEDRDRGAVAALHDRLFPATHTPGERLGEGARQSVLVAGDGEPLGYIAVETEPEDAGFISYLGVSPEARRTGVASLLVAAACRLLRDEEGCRSVFLSVRESNTAARRLYERLGFAEERALVPWRRGFSLEASA